MLDVALVGTGGFMPMPERFLSSLAVRRDGRVLLIDCGEGAQVSLRMLGWGFKCIDVICLTHFHADHVAGLPGLLLTIGNSGRTEPLTIVGPKRTKDVVGCLCVIAPVPFDLRIIELPDIKESREAATVPLEGFAICALPLSHWTDCFGYQLTVGRLGRFDVEKANKLGIPLKLWKRLQSGETVEHECKIFTPGMVLGPPRKGIKLSYMTDTRPVSAIPDFIRGSDLFVCEGIYGQDELLSKAVEHRHMIFSEAALLAKQGEVKELWLTHFSPAMTNPGEHIETARKIFPNTSVGRDRMTSTIRFEE